MSDVLKLFMQMSVMASIMIGIVLIVRKAFSKKMSPAIMLLLWGLVLIRLIFPFTLASPLSISDLLPEPAVATPEYAGESQMARTHATQDSLGSNQTAAPTQQSLAASQKSDVAETVSVNETAVSDVLQKIDIWAVLAVIWTAGAGVILFLFLRQFARFRKKLRFCNPVTDPQVWQIIKCHQKQVGIKKAMTVLECDFVDTPAVFGYCKPCILIPTRFLGQMERHSLNAILLHEVCHIRHRDILKSYIWLIAKVLHWFNPLVWLACKCFADDVEICRDHKAANRLDSDGAFVYSKSLLDAARFSKQTAAPTLAIALFENK